MGLFGKSKEGGFMDVIRCDEPEYLVWKWRPSGEALSTKKENAIRYGSSLRVKDGELAVFVYNNKKDGVLQDFIVGPYDQTIKTKNFPVLTSIVGLAFGGESPFQAEIYFMNLSGNIKMKFGIPQFDIFDFRHADFAVPVMVRGTATFNITDYKNFIKLNRLINFDLDQFKSQIKDTVIRKVKSVVLSKCDNDKIPVIQIERKIDVISEAVEDKLSEIMKDDFGVNLKRFDFNAVEIDKESVGYIELKQITADESSKTITAAGDVNRKNIADQQRINADNMEDALKIQREEAQRAQKLQTESGFIAAHQLNLQADVAKTAAESMGQMGSGGSGGGSGGSGGGMMDPGSMMASMAMGGAVGSGMAGSIGNMMQGMNDPKQSPPPTPPNVQYSVSVNGQQSGPFSFNELQMLVTQGKLTKETYVWKQGMNDWIFAGQVNELSSLFAPATPPPPPPPPPGPPAPPVPPPTPGEGSPTPDKSE